VRALVLVAVLAAGSAGADVLSDWTDIALTAASVAKQAPPLQSRTLAMVHVAMFDTIDAVDARYAPYKVKAIPSVGTSMEAAAAVAAHDVLVALFPGQTASLDASQDISLVRVTNPDVRASSLALGQRVAAAILALRASDGWDAPNTWRPTSSPGVYVPTTQPSGSSWGKVTPWLVDKADQFHPSPPLSLGSAAWNRDLNEVKSLGGKDSVVRTTAQTEAALFWNASTPVLLNSLVRNLMDVPGRSLVQNARLLALTSMVQADAFIAVFEAKYAYAFWRPITAVRAGEPPKNEATAAELAWEPLVETPLNPEYPSAHGAGAAAVAAVLEKEFGAAGIRSVRLSSPAVKAVHTWARLQDMLEELVNAQVWAGIHFRNSAQTGVALGRKLGEGASDKVLRPLK
jgi:hypothetical protein